MTPRVRVAIAVVAVALLIAGIALGRPVGTPVIALAVLVALTGAAFALGTRRRGGRRR